MKNTICIIPARSGSTGVKDKNIKVLKKTPLLIDSIQFAKKLNFVDKIVVSTDSKKYMNICNRFNFQVKNLRPKKLAKKYTPTLDVIKYELDKFKKEYLKKIKYVLILQPNCPFKKIEDFYKAYRMINKGYDTLITIRKVKDHPDHMIKIKKNELIHYQIKTKSRFVPRQKLEPIYTRSGSMYLFNVSNIKKFNSIIGKKIFGIEVDGKYALNIDSKEEMFLAKHYYK